MKNYLILYMAIILFSMSCKLEVNTSDPQSSFDIESSKRDKLFISEYQITNLPDTIFNVEAIWAEYSWKTEISGDKRIKRKTDGFQLNIKILKFNSNNFRMDNYLVDWEMKEKNNGYLGQSNGVFTFFINEKNITDSFCILINRLENNHQSIYSQFILKRSSE